MAKTSYDIRQIFDDMALDLIRSHKRTFLRHQGEQLKEGFNWEQWQLGKLRELNKYRQANKKIIGKYSPEIDKAVQKTLKNSYNAGANRVLSLIRKITERLKDMLNGGKELKIDLPKDVSDLSEYVRKLEKTPSETNFFSVNDKKFRALQQVVRKDMRKAQNAVLRKMDDVYRQTVYKAQVYMSSGATTLDQAVDMATKDFLAQGINCIQYKDGKMVNVASWAEMSLRTASHRATMLGEGSKMDEWDMHLVVITSHGNTCELCLPWQGKVLIDDVYSSGKPDGVHTLLSVAMAAGLFHPNCRHSRALYIPGITKLPKQPVSDDEALERYEVEQRQRTIENNIRKYKRLEAGSVNAENVNRYGAKVQEWQDALKQHLNDNTFLRKSNLKSVIEKTGSNDILSDRKWFKAEFSTAKRLDKHIKDHIHQYDVKPEQYINVARDLLAAPMSDDIEGFISKDGFLFKYRKSSNDFAIGRADGKISTLFKPDKEYDYWMEQLEIFKKR